MRRWVTALALTCAVSSALVGCSKGASSPAASGASSTATTPAATCPTTMQKSFVKTRFAADVGVIVGTTKHFVYTPYTQGKFTKGAHGRILSIIKAGAAAAVVVHFVHNAIDNAKADPALCKLLIQPLTDLSNALGSLKSKLKGGDLSAVTDLNSSVGMLESTAKSQGMSIVSKIAPGL